jgi:hypothetical protein
MDSVLQVLGWLCLGLGALFAVPALVALIALRHPGHRGAHRGDPGSKRAEARSDLGACTTAMAVGLSDVAGRAAHGALWWLVTAPLFTIVLINLTLWLRPRVRRRRARLQ